VSNHFAQSYTLASKRGCFVHLEWTVNCWQTRYQSPL